MKEVKKFLIASLIVFILKVVGGLVCSSYTLLASSLFEFVILVLSLFCYKDKENKKYKAIISSLMGFIIILLGLGIIFTSFILDIEKTSLFVLLFIFVAVMVKYAVGCFTTNINYGKKKGLLYFGNVTSNLDFYNYGIVILSLILCKVSKWVEVLKYADRVGTIFVSLMIIIKGLKIIKNSFKYLSNEEVLVSDSFKEEITKRNEINKINDIKVYSFGGIRKLVLDVSIKETISMIEINTFMVTLQDYLLKVADSIYIVMNNKQVKKGKINNARNSRSGNSKTNTKKKNTKKTNKKR